MRTTSKTQEAVAKFLSGDVVGALRIGSTFKIGVSKEEQGILKRGYECFVHPKFYSQICDVEDCKKRAAALFSSKFI